MLGCLFWIAVIWLLFFGGFAVVNHLLSSLT